MIPVYLIYNCKFTSIIYLGISLYFLRAYYKFSLVNALLSIYLGISYFKSKKC